MNNTETRSSRFAARAITLPVTTGIMGTAWSRARLARSMETEIDLSHETVTSRSCGSAEITD